MLVTILSALLGYYSDTMSSGLTIFLAILFILGSSLFWGFVTYSVMANKGYAGMSGFWWAFFFGEIAFAIAVATSEHPSIYRNLSKERENTDTIARKTVEYILDECTWTCPCGRENFAYISTCVCGRNQREVLPNRVRATTQGRPLTKEEKAQILDNGGWMCLCGRTNFAYVSTCACGKNRREVLQAEAAAAANLNTNNEAHQS